MTSLPPAASRPTRARRRWILLVALILLVVVAGGTASWLLTRGNGTAPTAEAEAPRLAVFSDTLAALHATTDPDGTPEQTAAEYLSEQPAAFWLVPERDPIGEVGERVVALADEAAAQDATPTIVVYGLPGRDCGNFSAGGLSDTDYRTWTDEIGDAVAASGVETIIVLEPDSIALAQECGNLDERATQLQGAVENLSADDARVYIDGGHSSWHSPEAMAEFIRGMGVIDDVRGFATNVSNYNTDADERRYAHALSKLLGGAHAVIDSGRNGAGSTGEWCNPPERRIGAPAGTLRDDVIDENLWIKVPGESDGTCNGGPPAGDWWTQSAVELTRDAAG